MTKEYRPDEQPTVAMERFDDAAVADAEDTLTQDLAAVADVAQTDTDTQALPGMGGADDVTQTLTVAMPLNAEETAETTVIPTAAETAAIPETSALPETTVLPTTAGAETMSETTVMPASAGTMPMPGGEPTSEAPADADAQSVEDRLTMPIAQVAQETGTAKETATGQAGASVPLYATVPPAPSAASWPGTEGQPTQPFVQVARQAPPEPLQKTGSSGATIALGVIVLLLGAAGIVFGLRFPNLALTMFNMSPQTTMAVTLGIAGGLLILVAILWAIVKAVHGRGKRK